MRLEWVRRTSWKRTKARLSARYGADYSRVTYGWTLELDAVKRSVDRQLRDLKTDYINYGFIHCMDASSDWAAYQKNGILRSLLDMKSQGVVRHMGASSHTPSVIREVLDTDMIDMLMFSVNPACDYHHGEYLGCHPCACTSSLKMRTKDVIEKFLPAMGHDYQTVHLTGED